MGTYKERLNTFTEENLPTLDEVVLGALDFFTETEVPEIDFNHFKRPLVVGSGNAAVTGRILFSDVDAVFADESTYLQKLDTIANIDGVYVISASGSKHAVSIVKEVIDRLIPVQLLTNNLNAPAREIIGKENTLVFPKNREPYTYNTSTYMGMLLSKTKGNPAEILSFIENVVATKVPSNLDSYDAYYFVLPEAFANVSEMIETKFNELFGPRVMGRIFTLEQTKHAKTVVPMDTELFVSFGEENILFGKPENRVHIPLPENGCVVAMMALSYYFVGQLQKQLPPYYMKHIAEYVAETSKVFNTDMSVIVE